MTAAARLRFASVRPKQRATLAERAAVTDAKAAQLDETLDALAAYVDLLEGGKRDPEDQISEHDLAPVPHDK